MLSCKNRMQRDKNVHSKHQKVNKQVTKQCSIQSGNCYRVVIYHKIKGKFVALVHFDNHGS